MDSQTSADDLFNNFDRSCSNSNLSDATFGVCNGCCAKEIEKLMVQLKEKDKQLGANKIQLEEKDKELEASKEENKKLHSNTSQTVADHTKIESDLFNLVEKLRIELHVKDQKLQGKDEELAKERQQKQTSTDEDAKLKSNLFDLAEKLRIQLHAKDQEVEDKNKEIKELSANLDVAMTQANKVDGLETELASSQQINHVLQMSLWKFFPPPDLSYYIKAPGSHNGQSRYLYEPESVLLPSVDRSRGKFKFTKNSDGSFFIYSKEKYLKTDTNSSELYFDDNNGNTEKFVIFLHQQNQQAGISVDICTLAGYFLCLDDDNFLVANSPTPPANKFLLVPVPVEECPVLVNLSNNNDVHFLFKISVSTIFIIFIMGLFYLFWSLL